MYFGAIILRWKSLKLLQTPLESKHVSLQTLPFGKFRTVQLALFSPIFTLGFKDLHWLPIAQHIEYKIIMMTFKSLNGLAPPYLGNLLILYQPSRTLRFSNDIQLSLPHHKYLAYGGRSFEVIAPELWNGLHSSMRQIKSLELFKKRLKTHLFIKAFRDH